MTVEPDQDITLKPDQDGTLEPLYTSADHESCLMSDVRMC